MISSRMKKTEAPKTLFRSFEARNVEIDEENRTLSFPFSSEEPVERWFGMEILSHDSGAMQMDRLNDGAPLLFNHDTDSHIGVVERSWIDNKRGMAKVRFGNSALAQEKWQDVKDKVLRKVSFGYMIDPEGIVLRKKGDESGPAEYMITRYTPFEVSFVTIPADNSVGLGRELEANSDFKDMLAAASRAFDLEHENTAGRQPALKGAIMNPVPTPVDVKAVAADAMKAERERQATIAALGEKFNMREFAQELAKGDKSTDECRTAFLEKMSVRQAPVTGNEADIGLTDREVQGFSFIRAINALANPGDRRAYEAAKFEIEVSEAAAKKRGKTAQGIFIPHEILRAKRDLTKGSNSAGGYTVANELKPESFIELLRKKSILDRAGARVLTGLVGDIAIPKQTGGATAYWVAESGSPTESAQTFGQVAMSPKTVGAYSDISRKLLIQSSIDIENLVQSDLAKALALAIDIKGLYGSGTSNEPLGVSLVSGLNTKDFAAAMPTFAELVAMESLIAADDADVENMKYLTEPTVRGALKTSVEFSSTASPIWKDNMINGYSALVSNQITAEDVFFGNWNDLMMGFWSGLDLMVDPYALSTQGAVRVIALQDVDVAVRHGESFCWGNDAQ
jgi:HK97 family phage major capsid protein